MTGNDRTRALMALRDCGVLRVRLGAVAPGFKLLQREGLLAARRIGEHHAHIQLNFDGMDVANRELGYDCDTLP